MKKVLLAIAFIALGLQAQWDLSSEDTVSTIHAPIMMKISDLENTLNSQLAGGNPHGELFSQSGIPVKRGTLQVIVKRNGHASLTVSGNEFVVSMPIHVSVRADWKAWRIRHHKETDFAITIHARISTMVDQNWQLRVNTIANFSWNEKPEIKIGPFDVRISGIAGNAINKQLPKLASKLSEEIETKVNSRKQMEKVWQRLHRKMQISQTPPIYLVSCPQTAYIGQLRKLNEYAVIDVALAANVSLVLHSEPKVSESPLPGPSPQTTLGKFILKTPLVMATETVKTQLASTLQGMQLPLKISETERVPFHIEAVSISFVQDKLQVQLSFKIQFPQQSYTGEIEFYTIPQTDKGSVDFTPKSSDIFWTSSAPDRETLEKIKQLREVLREKLATKLQFPYQDKIKGLMHKLNDKLNSLQIDDEILLAVRLDSFTIEKIIISEQNIAIVPVLEGMASVEVTRK